MFGDCQMFLHFPLFSYPRLWNYCQIATIFISLFMQPLLKKSALILRVILTATLFYQVVILPGGISFWLKGGELWTWLIMSSFLFIGPRGRTESHEALEW